MKTRTRRWVVLLLPAALLAGGLLYSLLLLVLQQDRRELWNARLAAALADRQATAEAWVAELSSDAAAFALYPTAIYLLEPSPTGPLPFPAEVGAAGHLHELLRDAMRAHRYTAAWLLDGENRVVALSDSTRPLPAQAKLLADSASRLHAAPVRILARQAFVAAPVHAKDAPSRILGVLVVEADPSSFLLQPLRFDGIPTRTGVVQLVAAPGGSLFSAARDSATLLLPAGLPVVAPGTLAQARDYRGNRVWVQSRPVAGAPWALVAKIDRSEALRGVVLIALERFFTLLAAAVLAILLAWRWARRKDIAVATERARAAALLDRARDAILFIGEDGIIRDVNQQATTFYGLTREQLIGRSGAQLRAPSTRGAFERDLHHTLTSGDVLLETRHVTADGTVVPVEISSRSVQLGGERTIVAIVRDLRERIASEERIALLLRLQRTLAEINAAIAREREASALLAHACDVAVEHGGFVAAWLGLLRPDGVLHTAAARGLDAAALERRLSEAGQELPVGEALRSGRIAARPTPGAGNGVHCTDLLRESEAYACAAVPLRSGTAVIGCMLLFTHEARPFDDAVLGVLEEVAGNLGFALDVMQERARAEARRAATEARLRDSEERFRWIAEHAPDIIYRYRVQEPIGFEYVNPAVERITGYTPEEHYADPGLGMRIVHPDDTHLLEAASGAGTDGGNAIKLRWIRKDGQVVWVEQHNVVQLDSEGKPLALVGIGRDITASETAERALRDALDRLRESEEKYRAIIENSPDVIARLTPEGRHLYVSPSVERYFPIPAEQWVGRTFEELGLPPRLCRFWMDSINEMLADGKPRELEYAAPEPTGPYFFSWQLFPELDSAGHVRAVVSVNRDISAKHRLEVQFQHSQKLEAVGRLAGGVAHDFNNILTAISGNAALLADEPIIEGRARDSVHEIAAAAERAAALTRQLLAFSRRELVQPRIVDLGATLSSTEQMLRRVIGEDISLQVALPDRPVSVLADPGQIEQVLLNLCVNARDAMPDGGTLRIDLSEQPREADGVLTAGHYAVLRVEDTGSGIPADVLEHIFEPFFTTKEQGRGTGLGLSTVYGIVQQCGGEVAVRSTPGEGTCFTVFLPAREPEKARPRRQSLPNSPAARSLSILLVEDEDLVRALIERVLQRRGHRVLSSALPLQALEMMETAPELDVLLTDVVMPEMGGRELAERVAAMRPGIRTLFITGYTTDAALKNSAESGVNIMAKPFTPAELCRRVEELVQ